MLKDLVNYFFELKGWDIKEVGYFYSRFTRSASDLLKACNNDLDKAKSVWTMEFFQRNCMARGLTSAKDEDRIIISDADEIPDPKMIMQVKDKGQPTVFCHHLFYYYVNCLSDRDLNGSIIIPFKNMTQPQDIRKFAHHARNSIKSGWHYTYMGGVDRIRAKLDNLSDAFTRIDQVGTNDDILRKMNSQKDLWDESIKHAIVDIEKDNLSPEPMREFIRKCPKFYFNQT